MSSNGHGVIGKFLVGLVPLPAIRTMSRGWASAIARAIASRAIGDFFVVIGAKTFLDFGDDRVRIFLPRIVGSDDAEVGILIDDASPSAAASAGRDRRRNRKRRSACAAKVRATFSEH